MEVATVLAAVLVVVGIVGVVLPILPGLVLVAAGVGVWAIARADVVAWTVLGIVVAILLVGTVVKYLVPGRRLRDSGVPGRTVAAGAVLGVVGFFVIPVVGSSSGSCSGSTSPSWPASAGTRRHGRPPGAPWRPSAGAS